MESIPDKLVEYLVDEIALNGHLGSTLQDVLSYLDKYGQTHPSSRSLTIPTTTSQDDLLDPNIQKKLWSRLASHPDLALKRQFQANPDVDSQLASNDAANNNNAVHDHLTQPGLSAPRNIPLAQPLSVQDEDSRVLPRSNGYRLHATAFRTQHVVCRLLNSANPGKLDKLSGIAFNLLSIIAASREDGVSHPNLVIASGQSWSSLGTLLSNLERIGHIKQQGGPSPARPVRWVLSMFDNPLPESAHFSNNSDGTLNNEMLRSNGQTTEYKVFISDRERAQGEDGSANFNAVPQHLLHSPNTGLLGEPLERDSIANSPGLIGRDDAVNKPKPVLDGLQDTSMTIDWTPEPQCESSSVGTSSPAPPRRESQRQPSSMGTSSPAPARGVQKRYGTAKYRYKDPNYKPLGRPRKFVRGTEQFWRDMFQFVRRQENPELAFMGRTGITDDPAGQEVFKQRPAAFDDTLVRALESKLPAPALPEDITQEWVDRTLAVLDRVSDGVYLTPRGEYLPDKKRKRHPSRVLIIRSPMLRRMNLSDQKVVAKVRFLASSAAHTFHYERYYPTLPRERPLYIPYYDVVDKQSEVQVNLKAGVEAQAEELPVAQTESPIIPQKGGPGTHATFAYYPSSPVLMQSTMSTSSLSRFTNLRRQNSDANPTPVKKRRRTRRQTFVVPEDSTMHSGSPLSAQLDSTMDLAYPSSQAPNPFGLPPPLITRGARRRLQAVQHEQQSETMGTRAKTTLQSNLAQTPSFCLQDPITARWVMVQIEKENSLASSSLFLPHEYVPLVDDGVQESGSDYEQPKKIRDGGRGGAAGVLRRNVILDIVKFCSGVIPYNSSCPKGEFIKRWEAEGQEGAVSDNIFKAAIKSLCGAGRLKQMKFSFRGKKGSMVVRNILAQPEYDATDPLVQQMQKKIIESEPRDYVPPGLESDGGMPSPQPGILKVNNINERKSYREAYHEKRTRDPTVLTLRLGTNAGRLAFGNVVAAARTKIRTKKKIAWMQVPGTQVLPESIAEILRDDRRPPKKHFKDDDPVSSRFEWEVDGVMMWELRTFNHFRIDDSYSSFINHTIEKEGWSGLKQQSPLLFTPLIWFSLDGQEVVYPFSPTPLPDLYNDIEDREYSLYEPQAKKLRRGPNETPLADRYTFASTDRPKQKYVRRLKKRSSGTPTPNQPAIRINKRKPDAYYVVDVLGNVVDAARGDEDLPIKRARGLQILRTMNDNDIFRIAVTIVVVRTLAGGLEKYIDWPIVMRMFPTEDEQFVKDRWKTLANRYRRDISGLTESLQERYLGALERGEVPSVDFGDLEGGTDWQGICDWAVKELDRGGRSTVEELPGSQGRATWVEDREFGFEEFKGLRELLGYNVNATGPRKEEAVGGVVFATDVGTHERDDKVVRLKLHAEEEERNDPDLTRVRSWVLATVLTAKKNYDDTRIRKKLMQLAPTLPEVEQLVDRGLKVLQRDRVVARNYETKLAGVLDGGWVASSKLYEHLTQKRMVTSQMLKEAAAWKIRALDERLDGKRSLVVGPTALVEDGHMIAILNLVASGRMRLELGDDVPKGRYGLDWEAHGYQTRMLDKKKLEFSVVVAKTEGYVVGDPMAERRKLRVPRGEVDDFANGRIPMWFDILGNFQAEVWEILVGAVIGLVGLRAGIGSVEIVRTLAHGLTEWEVGMMLGWAEESGFVRRTGGNGWDTEEWWWLALGHDFKWVV